MLRWRTASEPNTLGFNVYRQRGAARTAARTRLNRRVIPAHGSAAGGGAYSWRDQLPKTVRSPRYWLQVVSVDGSRTWRGPVAPAGTRITRTTQGDC